MGISRVLNGYTLVKVLEEEKEEVRPSGLVVPGTALHRLGGVRGEVVAVSDQPFVDRYGRRSWPEASEGEIVLYSFFRGKAIKIDGQEYRLLEPEEVLAVVEEDERS